MIYYYCEIVLVERIKKKHLNIITKSYIVQHVKMNTAFFFLIYMYIDSNLMPFDKKLLYTICMYIMSQENRPCCATG